MPTTAPAALKDAPFSTVTLPVEIKLSRPACAATLPPISRLAPLTVNSPPSCLGSPAAEPPLAARVTAPCAEIVVDEGRLVAPVAAFVVAAPAVSSADAILRSPPTLRPPLPRPITAPDAVMFVDANPSALSVFGPTVSVSAVSANVDPTGPPAAAEDGAPEPSNITVFAPNREAVGPALPAALVRLFKLDAARVSDCSVSVPFESTPNAVGAIKSMAPVLASLTAAAPFN